ncbi:MAG: NAD(P)/FAD-dependent oxidoreductase, partial [Leptolyngbya sp. SIO4C1]|nr:NAD(P)/FAD-dependent oxidoreductase [Leptolyngbya sp. SIO4C1]
MERFDYVILGAGLGGLSAAACLTRQGYRVVVLEQHYLPGGCCHTFDYGNYRFCADVHYISQCAPQQTIGQFLNYIERDVAFNSLDPDCIDRVIAPGIDFRIPLGWEEMRSRLLATFPDEALPINRYCDEIQQLHQQIRSLAQNVRWYDQKWSDWLKLPQYWHLFSRRHWTLQDLYNRAGLSSQLQTILAGQSGDYALPPAEIALITHASLVSDYAEGAYYPQHHFKQFVDTIAAAITEGGSEIRYATPVEHIEVTGAGGRVHHIVADGCRYAARRAAY